MKEEFFTYFPHKEGPCQATQDPRENRVIRRLRDGSEGNTQTRAFMGVSMGKARQGRQTAYSQL